MAPLLHFKAGEVFMKNKIKTISKIGLIFCMVSVTYVILNTKVIADNDRTATPEDIGDVISNLIDKEDFNTCVELSTPNGKTLDTYGTLELIRRVEVTRCYDIQKRHFTTSYRYNVIPSETVHKCFVNDNEDVEHEEIQALRSQYPDEGDADRGETYTFPKLKNTNKKTFKEVKLTTEDLFFDLNWDEENNKLIIFDPQTEEAHFIFEQITGFSIFEKEKNLIGFLVRCRR